MSMPKDRPDIHLTCEAHLYRNRPYIDKKGINWVMVGDDVNEMTEQRTHDDRAMAIEKWEQADEILLTAMRVHCRARAVNRDQFKGKERHHIQPADLTLVLEDNSEENIAHAAYAMACEINKMLLDYNVRHVYFFIRPTLYFLDNRLAMSCRVMPVVYVEY